MNAAEREKLLLDAEKKRLLDEARSLTGPNATRADLKRADVLLAQAKALRPRSEMALRAAEAMESSGLKAPEIVSEETRVRVEEREELRDFMRSQPETDTRSYSAMSSASGSLGGYMLPEEYQNILLASAAQYDDLLNEQNVRLIRTPNGRNLTLPSVDLSTISSQIVAQNVQSLPVANPLFAKNVFGGYTYRTNPIAVSIELEQDSFQPMMETVSAAFGIGLARGIGADLVNGTGSGQPSGLLTAALDSGVVSASMSSFGITDLTELYFSVNRAYRSSPKAAFVMSDTIYKGLRESHDDAGRPMIRITEDGETLFGKKIVIAPSMPSTAGSKAIVFGDLSQFIVRVVGQAEIKRAFQVAGYAEKGTALYTGHLRVDSSAIAPNSVSGLYYAKLAS